MSSNWYPILHPKIYEYLLFDKEIIIQINLKNFI